MSRSYRHSPYVPVTGKRSSEKQDKQMWHSRRRMLERVQDAALDADDRYQVSKHAAINQYNMNKDGHLYVGTRADYDSLRQYLHNFCK